MYLCLPCLPDVPGGKCRKQHQRCYEDCSQTKAKYASNLQDAVRMKEIRLNTNMGEGVPTGRDKERCGACSAGQQRCGGSIISMNLKQHVNALRMKMLQKIVPCMIRLPEYDQLMLERALVQLFRRDAVRQAVFAGNDQLVPLSCPKQLQHPLSMEIDES